MPRILHISYREAVRAFRAHKEAAHQGAVAPAVRNMCLVYSVECGLAAALMKRTRVNHSKDIPRALWFGHKINRALTILRVSSRFALPTQKTLQKDPQEVPDDGFHSAFRYSVDVTNTADVTIRLEGIVKWIEENAL